MNNDKQLNKAAVAYARYSSDQQRVQSIEEQLREINEYAIKKNYTIINNYCDFGISGASNDRPQFRKMLEDSRNRLFSYVLVFDYTRFSRGGEVGLADEVILTKNGVTLISITEDYGDTFGAKLIKHVKFLMAEEDLNKIRINTARGHKDNALKCLHNGGTPPLGYDVDKETKKYVINVAEAEAVKTIFEMFIKRNTYAEIIYRLNIMGIKTKRNNQDFKKNAIHAILKNKKYTGVYEFGKIKKAPPKTLEHKSQRIKNEDFISIENGIPAIIDLETWEQAQMILKTRQSSKKAKVEYLLTGKVYCDKCGSKFVGTSRNAHGKTQNFYFCGNRNNNKTCDNRSVSKPKLEKKVLEYLTEDLLTGEGIKWVISELERNNKEIAKKSITLDTASVNKQVANLEKRFARAKEGYLNSIIDIEEFKAEKTNYEKVSRELNAQTQQLKPVVINKEEIKKKLEKIRNEKLTDKELIDSLVEKVTINGPSVKIYLFSYSRLA